MLHSKAKDLEKLSSLGHFLKGSSATLGFVGVRDACERIQHFGQGKDETGTKTVDDREKLLASIKENLEDAEDDTFKCKLLMKELYSTTAGT